MANMKKMDNRSSNKKKKRNPSMTKRIRDVKRLLAKDNLDPKMRQGMEKRLAALLEESAENKRKFKERKYAIRYHRIRFFERVKLERSIVKLKRELANERDAEKTEGLRSMLAQAEDDLEYVLHFPKGEKYVSILKNSQDNPESQKILDSERKRLRTLVKKQLEDEAIVNEMDEGKGRASISAPKVSILAGKGPQDDGAEDSMELQWNEKEKDMSDDDFFLAESRSSSDESEDKHESEVDDISKGSQPLSSSSEEEQLIDTKETEASNVAKHNDIIQESNGPKTSHRDLLAGRKSGKVAPEKSTKGVSRQHAQKPPGIVEAKSHRKSRKIGKRDQVASRKASKSKTVVKQPFRTRAEGGRKRRRKAQSK